MPERDPHAIRHIACGHSDVFATAQFEKTVRVWSFARRSLLAEFNTCLDFGGRRLALIDGGDVRVAAAAYYREGVALYDGQGRVLWQRRDLTKPQRVKAYQEDGAPRIAVGFDEKSLVVVDANTGVTLGEARGTRAILAVSGEWLLSEQKGRVVALELTEARKSWSVQLGTFAVLDAAISSDAVAFSEAGGAVRCISRAGDQLWTWQPPEGSHVLTVGWRSDVEHWLLVSWPYQKGGDKNLVIVDRKGSVIQTTCIGCPAETAFLDNARYLVTSDGSVLRTEDGEEAWRFYRP